GVLRRLEWGRIGEGCGRRGAVEEGGVGGVRGDGEPGGLDALVDFEHGVRAGGVGVRGGLGVSEEGDVGAGDERGLLLVVLVLLVVGVVRM
ncbi:hypothetical protein PTTG_10946, partial [Puccinia triticina 1-1 BBBD Race 1]|uniref:Uncharacterized protein n=1 Tax=Puccinia triticina (isolate 1-1 / race 1 (BBBD)) TaxID=630390 RepID=A0A0C4FCJ2_PUCT1